MNPILNKRLARGRVSTIPEEIEQTMPLLDAFSKTSTVCFGICDTQFRFQAVNSALAALNGIPAEAHLGRTIRDVLGEVATTIEPVFERVLVTGTAVLKKISGKLPSRQGETHWIANYFPVKDSANRVKQLGGIVVDVTDLHKLDEYFSKFTAELVRTRTPANLSLARELHDSTVEYHIALMMTLTRLTQRGWTIDQSADEQLAPRVESLDQRIATMRRLASAVAHRFRIDQRS